MEGEHSNRYSRRGFLGRVGAGAGAVALGGTPGAIVAPSTAEAAHGRHYATPTTFGRIFPNLPAFAENTPAVQHALLKLGEAGGLLDARDDLGAGPVLLITDPAKSANNPNNLAHTAGTTFMGQFMDHDMTFDASSRLAVATDPTLTKNFRTPVFDLDSMYGAGPIADQLMYDSSDGAKLKIENGGVFEDLTRTSEMTAMIGDPRNDENMMIAGLHCAFIKFHNNAVDLVRGYGADTDAFAKARQLTTWHYHSLILHEFLPLFVGQAMVDDVLKNGRRYYKPQLGEAFMPVEFQGAAYRFGHSMVRPSYRANLAGDNGKPFFGMVFDAALQGSDPDDLRGGCRAARRFIGWQTFFDFGDGQVKPNKKIDTKLSTPLFNLPLGAIASHDAPTSLPQRNLLRQLTWSMPSGQSVAKAMGVDALSVEDLSELKPFRLEQSTPLWYYVLKEAEVVADGLHLGPVGGRIVAEVIIGLLQTDPASYLVQRPKWKPTLPAKSGTFRMTDFLTFAGVDPASRGQ